MKLVKLNLPLTAYQAALTWDWNVEEDSSLSGSTGPDWLAGND